MMIRNQRFLRGIALYLVIQFVVQIIAPPAMALTSGPSQPEFSSFEPVGTTNMVDNFSGDFTYNLPVMEVPGPQGSGYPLSLSYHSGASVEEEASWVGLGWTLNSGAINRNTQGLPDDYNGGKITFRNQAPKNWTVSSGAGVSFGEVFGVDLKGIGLGANASIRYNNYRGFGYNVGAGITLGRGLVSLGYQASDGTGSFSLNVNPSAVLSWNLKSDPAKVTAQREKQQATTTEAQKQKKIDRDKKRQQYNHQAGLGNSASVIGSTYGLFSYTQTSRPGIVNSYHGESFNVSVNIQTSPPPIPAGVTGNLWGNYTYQVNNDEPNSPVPAYGYLYSSNAGSGDLMDYHVEKEGDFNKRDVFLGVPFGDADNFQVSGEGIGGGFRLYNKKAGHFGPRTAESNVDMYNIGGEIGVGWTFGPGLDLGKGHTSTVVSDWNRPSKFAAYGSTDIDEPVFFRFNNDLGGEWGSNHDDAPVQAPLSGGDLNIPQSWYDYTTDGKRIGRSSYVGFHTNKEMLNASKDKVSAAAYSKNEIVNTQSQRALDARKDLIGELAVFNESGARYVYALPVYGKNEVSMSYSARGINSVNIFKNYIAFSEPNTEMIVGDQKNDEYASTYLLTEITTPDYVDLGSVNSIGENGTSPDDLGGYTRFNYKKGTDSDWYTWRMPYRGMLYNKNSHSDPKDDMVTYSGGEKELYYLRSVETKTHVAIFKMSSRKDAKESPTDANGKNGEPGSVNSQRLDQIDLYSIDDCVRDPNTNNIKRDTDGTPFIDSNRKPIKTVHFVYDYSLVKNVPNAEKRTDGQDAPDENNPTGANRYGKLTLKQVYFEYNGIQKMRISPYTFKYEYPTATEYDAFPKEYRPNSDGVTVVNDVTDKYRSLLLADQNPNYTYCSADPWGNYQPNGTNRFDNMWPWVDQTVRSNENRFDPACWNLKVITLPSGGQIHIQYEQDDYSYVQNQAAHVMANIKGGSDSKFYLDLVSIGLNTADTDYSTNVNQLVRMLRERYVNGGKKMYFKILYSLIGDSNPDLKTCNADFITGYVSISDCGNDSNGVWIQLKQSDQARLPVDVCKEFVKTQRLGKLNPKADCNASLGMSESDNAEALVRQLLTMATSTVVPSTLCKNIDVTHSFFRIPTPLAKKGGGLRVKRLMMFDKGFDQNPVLYGSEYMYTTTENGRVISSGVATNEPQLIREENILVDFIARKGQSTWNKIIAGEDRARAEGPLGESLLPGPSVGYSRVIVKNIYTGKSGSGFSVENFYTAKDYPIKLAHPDVAGTMTPIKTTQPDKLWYMDPLVTLITDKTKSTQGFSFVLNNMHGQPRSTLSYGGLYPGDAALESQAPISGMEYTYFEPGDKIPTMASLYSGVTMKNPGREVEMTFAQRKVTEESYDGNIEGDFQMTIIPLAFIVLVIPYPSAIPSLSFTQGELTTHSTSKVVRYPAIVKSTRIYQDGISHTEENLAFDVNTGKPVAVRSSDEFKGAYLAQSIPANWEYTDMGGKWKSEGKVIAGSFSIASGAINLGNNYCLISEFTPGDQIKIGDDEGAIFHVVSRDYLNNKIMVEASRGTTSTGATGNVTIVHTGRTNQLQAQAGAITRHDETLGNLSPIVVDQSDRYETNAFATDLGNAINAGSEKFTLLGIYSEMDMSAFSDVIPATCVIADISNVAIKNVEFVAAKDASGNITLRLMAFEIHCDATNEFVRIKGDGWE